MSSPEERRKTFDEVADLYDRFRPGYPAALVEDVVWLSRIPACGRILEIGCGTGKATTMFAERGYRITGLELGPNLVRVAERNLARFPEVRIELCTFEDWQPADIEYDLVMAAQSFHFIDARFGLLKAAAALRSQGAIAIFENRPQAGDSEVHRRVQEVYAHLAPALRPREEVSGLEDKIDDTGRFETVVMTRYRWQAVYAADEYVGLITTYSDHRLLLPDLRMTLFEAIRHAIANHGGSITIDYVTALHVARRRAVT